MEADTRKLNGVYASGDNDHQQSQGSGVTMRQLSVPALIVNPAGITDTAGKMPQGERMDINNFEVEVAKGGRVSCYYSAVCF